MDRAHWEESARLVAKGDQSLRKTRYLWLQGTLLDRHQASFGELVPMNLHKSRARLPKDQMIEFWRQPAAAHLPPMEPPHHAPPPP